MSKNNNKITSSIATTAAHITSTTRVSPTHKWKMRTDEEWYTELIDETLEDLDKLNEYMWDRAENYLFYDIKDISKVKYIFAMNLREKNKDRTLKEFVELLKMFNMMHLDKEEMKK